MKKILNSFFYYFLHPLKTIDFFQLSPLQLHSSSQLTKLSLYEMLMCSWIFVIANSLLRLLFIYLLSLVFDFSEFEVFNILAEIVTFESISTFYFLILSLFLEIIFFPILTLVIVHLWEFIIEIYCRLIGLQNKENKVREVLVLSMAPNVFLFVPFIGDFIVKIARVCYLFLGLRYHLHFSLSLSIVTLLTPFLMTFFLIIFFILAFALIVNL